MVDGVKSGDAPKAVTTYMEEESRRAFESGKYGYMRNWPYAYALGNAKGSKVADKFKVAPFPTFEGAGKAGILGGHNLVISAYSKNPKGAVQLIDFLTSREDRDPRRGEVLARTGAQLGVRRRLGQEGAAVLR